MFELSLLLISVIKSVPERSLPVASASMLGVSVCEGVSSSSLCFFHCSLLFSWVCINWSWIAFPHTAVCGVLAYSCEIAPFYLYSLHVFAQHKQVMWRHNNKTQWDREEEEEEEDPVCKGMSTFWGNTLKLSITIWYWHWYRYINIWIDPGSVAVSGVTGGEEPEITRAGSRLGQGHTVCYHGNRLGKGHSVLSW